MTLKEKVAEIEPGAIDAECWGGVVDCPCDYEFLIGHYDLNMTCGGPGGSRQGCGICWNSEYIEGYVTDTNVGNKNSKKESDKMGRVYQYNGKEFGVLRIAGIKNPCLCKVQGKATEVLAKFVDEEAGFEFLREVDELIRAYHEYIKTEEEYESDTNAN